MDGITFGAVYFFSSLMPFDLNVLPVEQVEKWSSPAGIEEIYTSWNISKPGEIEMKNSYANGNTMSTWFKVDAQGRILTQDALYADSARSHGDYSYVAGNLAKVVSSYNGKLSNESWFTWTDGKLATAEFISWSNPDTTFYRFFWIGDRIDSIHAAGTTPFPEGTGFKYTYPTRDSVHMVMHRHSGDLHFGFKLLNGRILSQTGILNSEFKYPASVGIRPGNPQRVPLKAAQGMPRIDLRDWLGRTRYFRPMR